MANKRKVEKKNPKPIGRDKRVGKEARAEVYTAFEVAEKKETPKAPSPVKTRNISWSEIRQWSFCRKKWYWMYNRNIVPKKGRVPLMSGSCGHIALAAQLQGQDWKAAVDAWVKSQIEEGQDLGGLFDEEIQEIQAIGSNIKRVIERYNQQFPPLQPVVVEKKFHISLPLPGHSLVGIWDGIVKDKDGALWLLEHKFPQKSFASQEDLLLNSQLGLYQWAARSYGYKVVGTLYDQVLYRLPAEPKILKDGKVSRATIYTNWETYSGALKKAGQQEDDYLDVKEKISKFKFFQRDFLYHSGAEIKGQAREFMHKVWDLTRKKQHIYMAESIMNCRGCPYKELCQESLRGGDVESLISANFQPRRKHREVQIVDETGNAKQPDSPKIAVHKAKEAKNDG